jgi:ornithine carbamoyltransferase
MKTLKTCLSNKNILSLLDVNSNEILSILKLAEELKKEIKRKNKWSSQVLEGKVLGMLFLKPSTRTRVSFEVGMYQMGGNAVYMDSSNMQLARGESIEDTARTLSIYLNCIVARVYDHSDLKKLTVASIPVINGLSDTFHPCQILADLMTVKEHKKKLKGTKIAWIGDGNNVCNDLLIGCAKTGVNVKVACPKGYEPPKWIVSIAKHEGETTGSQVHISDDPFFAVHREGRRKRGPKKDFRASISSKFTINEARKKRCLFHALLACNPRSRGHI